MAVLLGTVLRLIRVSQAVSPGQPACLAAALTRTTVPVRPPGTLSITLSWRRRRPILPPRLMRAPSLFPPLPLPPPRVSASRLSNPPHPDPISLTYRVQKPWATSPGGPPRPGLTDRTAAQAQPPEPSRSVTLQQ